MKLSSKALRALSRYSRVAPYIGACGTCLGIGVAFHDGSDADASAAVLMGVLSLGVTLALMLVALVGCVLYEVVRARRAA